MGNDNVFQFPSTAQSESIGRFLIPEQLTEARLASRLTQTDLASAVGISRQAISAFELGVKKPDPIVLQKIAVELEQPISFFTKETRASFGKHSANFFRKVGADTKRRNQACQVLAKWLSSTAYAFADIARFPDVDIPQYEPEGDNYTEDEIESIAERVRQHFGLGLGPISNMLRLLEAKGVVVARYKLKNENIEAFSFWSGKRPFIFLASEKFSATRARFDAAHELAHLCLHRWVGEEEIEDKEKLKQIESEADRFAGAFLLPRKSFPNEVYSPRAESFKALKKRWKVSIQAMVYRCKDLGLFDERQITSIYKQISYKKWRTNEPYDVGDDSIPFEDPKLLPGIADLVVNSGRYKIDEFQSDLSLSNKVIEGFTGLKISGLNDEVIDQFTPSLK